MRNQSANKKSYLTKDDVGELDFTGAKKRVTYWIAKKDYTESEIREKLIRWTNADVVNATVEWCHELKLIPENEKFSESIVRSLNIQKKGIQQINQKLKKKGLAQITADRETELVKAADLIQKKMAQFLKVSAWKALSFADKQKTKAKVFRFLATRGFTSEIIISSFNEWLTANKDTDNYEYE